ncbi:diphosphomevalonate decarboxylase [Microbacterium marinilacus]|uniref:diphosphomevalonate decarboxylase n=1 Tax=Microbacterium marinilacus TaxID=415209 RepID=A0ABP7BEK0_9MICO|nr:diphosphomevalonate decarboxylase [Microbacterium marinilacus]MBY0688880.1 diphosphomevalonate decarboxylase [Microbacterium marinilacus]
MTAATAHAHPNIALVKYWGKRDEQLMLPQTGSLSMTLDILPTTTTVELDPDAAADEFVLGDTAAGPAATGRVVRFLDLVRERAGRPERAVVRSVNTAPTGAGMASSAAGFAALAGAASAAYGLPTDARSLSVLARRGSGSAARSVIPGLAVWHAGHDDSSSFAEPVDAPPMRLVAVSVDAPEKAVSSREGMRRTALTSPFHTAWTASASRDLEAMLDACRDGDFSRIGRIAETNALRMHAVTQAADPPIRYLRPSSIAVLDEVQSMRRAGLEAYATADAGPHVFVLARPADADAVARALAPLGEVRVAGPGPGVRVERHDERHGARQRGGAEHGDERRNADA